MKVVIVGGVAGGASAAARIRRLDERSEVVVFERGEEPSFANCGLPYYVGGVIEDRRKLLVAPKQMLTDRHRLDVRTHSNVLSIDRQQKTVHVRNLLTNQEYDEAYDKLILAPGAAPWRPDITGINLPGVYTLRDLKDADVLHAAVARGVRSAVVVGAGFIGVEVAENLVHRGVQVTVIELANQILPPWDAEMVSPLQEQMASRGVHFVLGASATQIVTDGEQLTVTLSDGGTRETDMVILAVGVRPENSLAKSAGIDCGPRGGIVTNEHMQTNDPDIYAVGDAVEVTDFNTGQKTQIPLAGPANRQGRIAADHICGRPSTYRGTQGTAIVGAFGMAAAMTGLSEKQLRRMEIPHERIYIHPSHHAGYYPGARPMTLKLLFSPSDGRILGAQAVGWDGVDKRIDVLAIALQAGMTVYDLEEVELCYAPQFGSAKDPINMAGFVAAGVLREDHPVAHATDLVSERPEDVFVLDVRTQGEWDAARVTGATHIPLEQLRSRLHEVPTDSKTIAYCKVGQRGYLATRILLQSGRAAANLSGGITSWQMANGETVGGD